MNLSSTSPIREAAVILGLTIVGGVVRVLASDQLGLSHFDEGIYAMAGFWAAAPDGMAAIPTRLIPFAPPGLSIVIGVSYLLFGFDASSAIGVSQAAGIATIPIAGWIGRRTFGPGAGAATSAFAAISGTHVLFSRMALTDVPFLLTWMLGIGLAGWFLERPRFGRAVLLGLAIGVAQNFKYNGWLLAVVVAIAAATGLVRLRADVGREATRTFGFGFVAVLIALVIDLPWIRFVEDHGSYRKLLEHHRGYVDGLGAWPRNWSSQMDQSVALSGGPAWGASAGFLAILGIALVLPWFRLKRASLRSAAILGVVGLGLAAALAAFPNLAWWVGLGMTPWLLVDGRPTLRVLGAWWLHLTILTPFYHPYARLWLPLQAASWLVLAGYITRFLIEEMAIPPLFIPPKGLLPWGCTTWLALLVLLIGFGPFPRSAHPRFDLLRPTNDLAKVAGSIEAETFERGALRLLASPALEFELRLRGVPVEVERDLEHLLKPDAQVRWALVDEVILIQGPEPNRARARLFDSWMVVRELTYSLGLAASFDVDPGLAVRDSPTPMPRLWLLRPRPSRDAR